MEASPVRVIQYFDGTKQSLIPLFQRPYTWSKKDWETLWRDVLTYYGSDEGITHFMGAIVSVPARTVPIGVTKFLIIDGQQRLTTVSILLAALRDAMATTPDGGRVEDYLVNRHFLGADHLKLVPTQGDRPVYKMIIQDKALPTQPHPMKNAYLYFAEQIRGMDDDGYPLEPVKILQVLEHALQVVMINLGDADDPYLIFESLNYKGEPLAQGDLVRNFVLMRFNHSVEQGGEQEEVYLQYWRPLEETLGSALTEFLRHYLTKDSEEPNRGGIYAAVKSKFGELDGDGLRGALGALVTHSRYYARFLDPLREPDQAIAERLIALQQLEITTSYPLMLRLFDYYETGVLSSEALQRALGAIESFIMRRAVCSVPTNALNKLFSQWARSISKSDPVGWLRMEISRGEGSRRCPRDEEFLAKLQGEDLYRKKGVRYLLVRLEGSFGSREPASLDKATVEHVMPQTLSETWKSYLGDQADMIHQLQCHTLGNLTLSALNSELGNMPFDEKKTILAGSHIDLNNWIVEQSSWGEDEILERGRLLALRARELWPMP